MTLARRRAILWPRFGRERQFPGHRMAVAVRSAILWTMTDALLRWGDSGATICEWQDAGESAEVPSPTALKRDAQ